jgi:quercetin dioxygenase-like cupin family protein
MLSSKLTRALRTSVPRITSKQIPASRSFSISKMASQKIKPNAEIPSHESPSAYPFNFLFLLLTLSLVHYFPKITTTLPASSPEFRKVLFTGLYSQVVIMTIPVGGDIGDEVHTVDQALTFTNGKGMATINGKDQAVEAGDLMVVPAGTQHQFVNTGDKELVSA